MMLKLLDNVYHPDVLSCLADLSNDEVFTSPKVAKEMIDILPQELFKNPNTKFLDPACKSGIFLREITERLNEGLKNIIPDPQKRIDHILHNQIYGIGITHLTALLSRRSVYCSKDASGKYSLSHFDNADGNIRFKIIKHTWDNGSCKYCGIPKSAVSNSTDRETHPPLETKSITLTCGKLTTGVTVKPWTGIFMLRNLNSPETYFQSAFRVQSPWTVKTDDGGTVIVKQECFVFDFDINRALRQLAEYSSQLHINGDNSSNQEQQLGEFVHFLPVIAYDGSAMVPVDAEDILEFVTSGTTATMLARRWESATLVKVDNETLKRLLANPDALKAVMNIEAFRTLGPDIEKIINKSESVKKAKREGKNLTKRQKKKLTEEEKEFKNKRKEIQDKLIHFATRIPIFMYLTDAREKSLKEVILQIESDLFKRVTGITIPEFKLLTDLGLFDTERMNDAVWRFKRYEDASLEYTGINRHIDDKVIGLYDKTITIEQYRGKVIAPSKTEKVDIKDNFAKLPDEAGKKTVLPLKEHDVKKQEKIKDKKPLCTDGDSKNIEIVIGARVSHKVFGKGSIIKFNRTGSFDVKFDRMGIKKFLPDSFEKGFLTME